MLGDPRTNQNPGVLALAIVFYRWHNFHAMLIKSKQPDWVDEDVFQAARRKVIATMQVSSCVLRFESVHAFCDSGQLHAFCDLGQHMRFRSAYALLRFGICSFEFKCVLLLGAACAF